MKTSSSVALDRPVPAEEPQPRTGNVRGSLHALATSADVRKGLFSIFDQAIFSGTSFATAVIIGRACSREELGVYYLAFSLVLLARGIQTDVVSAPYIIFCGQRRGLRGDVYAGSTLIHHALLAALVVVGLLALVGLLAWGIGPAALLPTAGVLLFIAPILLLRDYIRYFAFAHLQHSAAVTIDAIVALLQITGLLLLAGWGILSVQKAYLVMGAACVVASTVWFFTKKQPLRFVPSRFVADWHQNWSFGKWALACQLVGSMSPYVMPWILVAAHGEAATGTLAACYTLIGLANVLVIGVANFLMPRAARAFASGGTIALRRVLTKAGLVFAIVLGLFCLFVVVSGDFLATVVYGDKYVGSGLILAILACAALANSTGTITGGGLWAIQRPKANLIADSCGLLVTLSAALLLVVPLGVLGAAISSLIGAIAAAAARYATLEVLLRSMELPSEEGIVV